MSGVPTPHPLAEALDRVGDRWSLLLVAALLEGPAGFNELQERVAGIAANVLSQRLKHLERERVIVARPYSKRPVRLAYELTARGAELADALRLLAAWGAALPEAGALRHGRCGTALEVRWDCPACAALVPDPDGRGPDDGQTHGDAIRA